MALNTLWLEVILVVLCINGGIMIVGNLMPSTTLLSPFNTNTEVVALTNSTWSDTYNFTNPSGTLVGNLTGSQGVSNSTIGGNSNFLQPIDFVFQPLAFLWSFIQYMTVGFAINLVVLLGFPDIFITVMGVIFGFLVLLAVVYYWTGR